MHAIKAFIKIVMSMLHLTKGVAVFCVLCFSLTYFVECDATDHLI